MAAAQQIVPIEERIHLIKTFPCFAQLTQAEAAQLAELFQEVHYSATQKIVVENDLVDSVYIIVDGEAEVSREIKLKRRKKPKRFPLSLLRTGEAIGLNDTGFYSTTGKRTATVTAMSDVDCLRLDIKDLYAFLQKNNLENAMYDASAQMLRMRFIKQSLPFSKLSHERLQWLAQHVDELFIPAGSIIFNQGDVGDKCYLIRSGEVEIIGTTQDNALPRQLALLKPFVLFGEATLITHSPRNATARAVTDCELLVLQHEHLSELLESEHNVAHMFMSLMVDRSRPIQNPVVTLHKRTTADGQEIAILKNPENASYFKLSEEGVFIWHQLNGEHTLQDITLNLADKFNVFAPDVVVALISKLTKFGFLSNLTVEEETKDANRIFWVRWMIKLRRLLEIRYAFGDADAWISRIYQKYIRYLFLRPVMQCLLVLIIIGLVAFIVHTPNVLIIFSEQHANFFLILVLIPFSLLSVFLHELGHAFAVKAFGREVHYIGAGWYWFAPIAFTDTSDMWLATRRPRMLVNLAGVFVDGLIAGCVSLIILLLPSYPDTQCLLWLFAFYIYIGILRTLSPLQEMDGYYVLMDWLEKSRLRQSSVIWLVKKFPHYIRHPSMFKEGWYQYRTEIIYWIACLFYLILISVLTLVIQNFILIVFGYANPNPYLSLILPFLVVVFSCLSIIADIRSKAED